MTATADRRAKIWSVLRVSSRNFAEIFCDLRLHGRARSFVLQALTVELWRSFLFGSCNGAMVVFLTAIMP